jgi:hypothetical protein
MVCTVTPQQWDSVHVRHGTGILQQNSRLLVTMSHDQFTAGAEFVLLRAEEALVGRFGSESIKYEGSREFTPEIIYDYDMNVVKLYLSPN